MRRRRSMYKMILLIFALLLFTNIIYAQPNLLWSRTYGGRGMDECFSIIETDDEGLALAGYTSDSRGFYLIKTNSLGESEWSRVYRMDWISISYSVVQTDDSGYAIVGEKFNETWLIRTDVNGDSLWSQRFGGEDLSVCYSLIQTVEGGFAITGRIIPEGEEDRDLWLIKTNDHGVVQWSRTFGGDNDDEGKCVIQSADGGYVVAGVTKSFDVENEDFWLVKTDSNGNMEWDRVFRTNVASRCLSLVSIPDGGFALAGMIFDRHTAWDMWLVRTGAEGDSLWSRQFNLGSDQWATTVINTVDGGLALAGHSGNSGFILIKTDSEGNQQWMTEFGGELHETCNSVVQTTDRGYALAGHTESFGAGMYDIWLVKTEPDQVRISEKEQSELPTGFVVFPAYPNPFNSTTIIKYTVPIITSVSLQVFDIQGRLVETLVDGVVVAGRHSVVWDAGEVGAGVYMLRMKDEGGRMNGMGKVVLIR